MMAWAAPTPSPSREPARELWVRILSRMATARALRLGVRNRNRLEMCRYSNFPPLSRDGDERGSPALSTYLFSPMPSLSAWLRWSRRQTLSPSKGRSPRPLSSLSLSAPLASSSSAAGEKRVREVAASTPSPAKSEPEFSDGLFQKICLDKAKQEKCLGHKDERLLARPRRSVARPQR